MRSRYTVSNALAERSVLFAFLNHEYEGRHVHALEPHPPSHGNDHGRPRSGDPGHAPGKPRPRAARLFLDTRRDPNVPDDDFPCFRRAHQRGAGFRAPQRMAENVLVVPLLSTRLWGNGSLVHLNPELAAVAVFPPRAFLWRLAASDFFSDATCRPGGKRA